MTLKALCLLTLRSLQERLKVCRNDPQHNGNARRISPFNSGNFATL